MTRKVVLDMESRTYDLHQLTDSFRRLYAENIAEAINWGDMVEVYGAVDEDKRMRTRLIDELQESVDRVGAYLDAQIVYASRSGYSWLTEYVIPRLRGLKPRKVIIQVKPAPVTRSEADTDANLDGEKALPCNGEKTAPCDGEKAMPCDGEKTVPCDGEKAVPCDGEKAVPCDGEKAMPCDGEKAVPWDGEKAVPCDGEKTVPCDGEKTAPFVPQEMAGVDVVIARELRIRPEDVVFEEYNGKADWTYVCLSENAKGVRTNAGAFKSRFSDMEYAGTAAVPRTTGYIQVFVNNDKVLDRSIKTEAEQAWELYMDEVLPAFATYLENNVGGDGSNNNSGNNDNSNSTDDEDNKEDVDHKVNKNEDCKYNGERGSKASPSLRVDLAIGTSGLTVIEDDLSKSSLEGLCEAMMAVGDKYLKALGFDFDGKTAAEAGVLNVTTVEYLGNPQLRVSV